MISRSTVLCLLLASNVFADEIESTHRILPDGGIETRFSQADGTRIKQTFNKDGSTTVDATDVLGNETITTTQADGSTESRLVRKAIA